MDWNDLTALDGDVAIYSRLSLNRDGSSTGTDRQEQDALAWLTGEALGPGRIYTEDDTSAFGSKKRPQFEELLRDIEAGRYQGVVVWKLDRLCRRVRDLERFLDACEKTDTWWHALDGLDSRTSGANYRFLARITAGLAEEESRNTSYRQKRKQRELAESGRFSGGGTRAYGLDAQWKHIVKDEAAVIEDCAKRLFDGEAPGAVIRRLNEEGKLTATGMAWTHATFTRLMSSYRLAGYRLYEGQLYQAERVEDRIPAILTLEEVERLRSLVLPGRSGRKHRKHLLSGYLHCAVCDATLHLRTQRNRDGSRRDTFICKAPPDGQGCGKVTMSSPLLPLYVSEAVLEALEGAGTPDEDTRSEKIAALEAVTAKLQQLGSAFAAGTIDMETLAAASPNLKGQKEALEAELARNPVSKIIAGSKRVRDEWAQRDVAAQRALIGLVVDKVVIHPAARRGESFRPERIEVRWKV